MRLLLLDRALIEARFRIEFNSKFATITQYRTNINTLIRRYAPPSPQRGEGNSSCYLDAPSEASNVRSTENDCFNQPYISDLEDEICVLPASFSSPSLELVEGSLGFALIQPAGV